MKRHIPNILTIGRVVLCFVNFIALAAITVLHNAHPDSPDQAQVVIQVVSVLAWVAVVSFVVAAISDFFDGWLARRWQVVSTFGAILDPIADKILVCGAILGLTGLGVPGVLLPGTLILFREFSVSAMREVLAPRGIKLPVTFLAKTKTTVQLVALTAIMVLALWGVLGGGEVSAMGAEIALRVCEGLMWLAALITVWTGVEYAMAASKALKALKPVS
jgi:cardiolipin synthase